MQRTIIYCEIDASEPVFDYFPWITAVWKSSLFHERKDTIDHLTDAVKNFVRFGIGHVRGSRDDAMFYVGMGGNNLQANQSPILVDKVRDKIKMDPSLDLIKQTLPSVVEIDYQNYSFVQAVLVCERFYRSSRAHFVAPCRHEMVARAALPFPPTLFLATCLAPMTSMPLAAPAKGQ